MRVCYHDVMFRKQFFLEGGVLLHLQLSRFKVNLHYENIVKFFDVSFNLGLPLPSRFQWKSFRFWEKQRKELNIFSSLEIVFNNKLLYMLKSNVYVHTIFIVKHIDRFLFFLSFFLLLLFFLNFYLTINLLGFLWNNLQKILMMHFGETFIFIQDGFPWYAYCGSLVGLFPYDRQRNRFSKYSQCSNV